MSTYSKYANQMCNVVYMVGGKKVETPLTNKARSVAAWFVKTESNNPKYTSGKLIVQAVQ